MGREGKGREEGMEEKRKRIWTGWEVESPDSSLFIALSDCFVGLFFLTI